MIQHLYKLRPRYNEVDQMGYVYHANYVTYCHQARTELMRTFGIHDAMLEANNMMIPVIDISLKYHTPAHYDEELTIETTLLHKPSVRLCFQFKIFNSNQKLVCSATSTVVVVNKETRKPIKNPTLVTEALNSYFNGASE